MPTKEQILKLLPDYGNEWELVKQDQYVPDIMREIEECQKLFSGYYDIFGYLFKNRNPGKVADELAEFCRKYIRYREETVESQTSAIPAGILTRGYGDCKHYALFCGGVLGALNRECNAGIEWCFCFASYKKKVKMPYHVFVALMDGDTEVWIDPTPGSGPDPKHLYRVQAE